MNPSSILMRLKNTWSRGSPCVCGVSLYSLSATMYNFYTRAGETKTILPNHKIYSIGKNFNRITKLFWAINYFNQFVIAWIHVWFSVLWEKSQRILVTSQLIYTRRYRDSCINCLVTRILFNFSHQTSHQTCINAITHSLT